MKLVMSLLKPGTPARAPKAEYVDWVKRRSSSAVFHTLARFRLDSSQRLGKSDSAKFAGRSPTIEIQRPDPTRPCYLTSTFNDDLSSLPLPTPSLGPTSTPFHTTTSRPSCQTTKTHRSGLPRSPRLSAAWNDTTLRLLALSRNTLANNANSASSMATRIGCS